MRRLFFSLYLVIFAAVIALVVGLPLAINMGLGRALLPSLSSYAETPRWLFENEFSRMPQERWLEHMGELEKQFEYKLQLLGIDDIKDSDAVMDRLRRGEVSTTFEDDDLIYLPIRGSDYVVIAYLEQTVQEKADRLSRGYFYLIDTQLALLQGPERAEYFRNSSLSNNVPIHEISISDRRISTTERESLLAGEIVLQHSTNSNGTYLKRSAPSDRVIMIGPITNTFLDRNLIWMGTGILVVTFGFAVFLWLRPIWNDMLALDRGTEAFGHGKLDERVVVRKRSPISGLVLTFNAMAKRIKTLVSAQKELTDAVSHELRTPISRLRFGMDRLENALSERDKKRFRDGMHKDIDELDQLVDELLTYSRLRNTAAQLSLSSVELEPWLERIISDYKIINGDIEITSYIDSSIREAIFDEYLMARALNNLIRNALRYASSMVKVSMIERENQIRIDVEDDGPGIPLKDRASLFEPFVRAEQSRSRESGGHGLGLAIAKRICDWHGASLTISNLTLGGAAFTISIAQNDLPIAARHSGH